MLKCRVFQSAKTAYGATLPSMVYFSFGTHVKDPTKLLGDRLEKFRLMSVREPSLNQANLAAVAGSMHDFHMPDIAPARPSTVSTTPPSTSTSSSIL